MTNSTPVPAGPWVLVVGAHRSGTSAVTGALVAMGLGGMDPGDRMDWNESNPEHWESLGAALLDEELLLAMGGSWDAPPEEGVQVGPIETTSSPGDVMAAAYPTRGPVVWKDPRVCLLLPYWREVLPGPLTAVLVWRDPMSVARSLHTRDGMSIEYGLALWERYTRSALAGLQGIDTYVLEYGNVVENPAAAFGAIAEWLAHLDRIPPPDTGWDVAAAAATIDSGLRHQSGAAEGAAALPDETRVLTEWLPSIAGGHRSFDQAPPAPVTPWPDALVSVRREQWPLRSRLHDTEVELERARLQIESIRQSAEEMEQALRSGYGVEIDRMVDELHEARDRAESLSRELSSVKSSASWKVTRPLRSAATRVSGQPKT